MHGHLILVGADTIGEFSVLGYLLTFGVRADDSERKALAD